MTPNATVTVSSERFDADRQFLGGGARASDANWIAKTWKFRKWIGFKHALKMGICHFFFKTIGS